MTFKFESIAAVLDKDERNFLASLSFSEIETDSAPVKTKFGWLSSAEFGQYAAFYNALELEQAPFFSGVDGSDGCIYRWYRDGRKQLMVDANGKMITPANEFLQ